MVGVAQGPGFIGIEVGVAPYARPGEVGVGQEASLSIKRRAVTVETRSKDDGDVHVPLATLQGAVGNRLEVEWRHALPHVEGSPDGLVGLARPHLRGHILNTERQ